MKTVTITLITLYQVFFAIIVKQVFGITAICRFSPTCSLYTQRMIRKHGVIKGGGMGFVRILSCNPLNRYGTI